MINVYLGWDGLDALAYEVAKKSILKHSTADIKIIPLKQWKLRYEGIYWRPHHVDESGQRYDSRDGKPFSTDFSFTRFLVPVLEDYGNDWALFIDPDIMFRGDIAELIDLLDDRYSVMCVKHDHKPEEAEKMAGLMQTLYKRKNWSSLVAFKPSRCKTLTKYAVNNKSGSWLHGMCWVPDEEVGALPEEWNWLCGWSDPDIDPKNVHFTRGTPDLPGCEEEPYADEWREYAQSCDIYEPEGVPSVRRKVYKNLS